MHPLTEDITKLTDEEIQKKLSKLYKVLQTTSNYGVRVQAEQMLEDYAQEQIRREDVKIQKQLEKAGSSMDEIIDIS